MATVPSAAAPSPAASSVSLRIAEFEAVHISPALFPSVDILPGTLRVETQPGHGSLSQAADDEFVYVPRGRFGEDYVAFRAFAGNGYRKIALDLRIQVFPSVLPIYGAFAPAAEPSYGLYHLEERFFRLCEPDPVPSRELACRSYRVDGAEPGWYPVYGDWDGDLWNLPSLFDPLLGELHQLAWNGDESRLLIERSKRWPSVRRTVPVAGDWDSTGVDGVLFLDSSGKVVEIRDPFGVDQILDWGPSLSASDDEALLWPFVWRVADGDPAREAIAVMDPKVDLTHWLLPDGRKIEVGSSPGLVMGFEIPIFGGTILGDLDAASEVTSFSFLQIHHADEHGLRYEVWNYHGGQGSVPNPQTVPLTFPTDPPGP
ncbi:MAG: hypothetical protein MPN21_12945 [Thermoanaerobaculia bacterium]|nr:hypothetical protein [Thermoanaerobaculia bacterium]